jgi:hypothetical protein
VLRFATLYGLSPRMRFDLTVNEVAAVLSVRRRLEVYGDQFWRPEDPRDYRVSFGKIEALGFTASRTVPEEIDEVIDVISSGVIGDFTEVRYKN